MMMSISWKPLPGTPVTDPPSGGTWELKGFNAVTLRGAIDLAGTLVADGKGGYQGFGSKLILLPMPEPEGEVVKLVVTGSALFHIDLATDKVQVKDLTADQAVISRGGIDQTSLHRDGVEMLRQCINEEISTMTLDEMLERATPE